MEMEALTYLLGLGPGEGARERRLAERDWNMQAECRGLDGDGSPFFAAEDASTVELRREAPHKRRERIERAKAVCSGCPVALRCLTDALDYEATVGRVRAGVWGGTDEGQRDRLAASLAALQEAGESVREDAA